MLCKTFRDELKAKELATGLALLVDGVGWVENHATRNLDPLPDSLTQAQKDAINQVVYAHVYTAPATYNGIEVWSAATVDAVTVKRIEGIAGDINSQLKALRLAVWAQHVKSNGNAFGQADKDKADAIIATSLAMNAQIEAIRAEGIALKQSKGFV